jgi:ribosome-binding factor A
MDRAKVLSALEHVAAEFVNRESNRQSLITVTRAELDERGLEARIFVSVYPDTAAHGALDFLNRNTGEFKQFVRSRLKMHDIHRYRFVQDPNLGGLEVGKDQEIA